MHLLLMLLGLGGASSANAVVHGLRFPNLQPPIMILVFLALLAAALALAWRVYRHEPAYLVASRRRGLMAVRMLSYLLLLFMFTGAVADLSRFEAVKGNLLILVDASRSMGIVDPRSAPADIASAVRVLGEARKGEIGTATRTVLASGRICESRHGPAL